jgi:hypothetical protein
VRVLSKGINALCSTPEMEDEWLYNNFSLNGHCFPSAEQFFEEYCWKVWNKNSLWKFAYSFDLEVLARKLIQRRNNEFPFDIQILLINDAVRCLKEWLKIESNPSYVITLGRTLLHSGK